MSEGPAIFTISDIKSCFVQYFRVSPFHPSDLPHPKPEHLDLHVVGQERLVTLGGETDWPHSVTVVNFAIKRILYLYFVFCQINLNETGVSSSSKARSCPAVILLRGSTLSQPGLRMILATVTLTASAPASVLSLIPRWTWSWSGEVRRHSRGHRDLAQSSGVMDSQGSRHVRARPLLVVIVM